MKAQDWIADAAEEINKVDEGCFCVTLDAEQVRSIIAKHCPFTPGAAYVEAREPPLLQCVHCKNTESPAGAMARQFNHGRCLHCGGSFKVVRA